jgi:hypothetical protein
MKSLEEMTNEELLKEYGRLNKEIEKLAKQEAEYRKRNWEIAILLSKRQNYNEAK